MTARRRDTHHHEDGLHRLDVFLDHAEKRPSRVESCRVLDRHLKLGAHEAQVVTDELSAGKRYIGQRSPSDGGLGRSDLRVVQDRRDGIAQLVRRDIDEELRAGESVRTKSASEHPPSGPMKACVKTDLLLSALLFGLAPLLLGLHGPDVELERAGGKAPFKINALLAHLHLQMAAGDELL